MAQTYRNRAIAWIKENEFERAISDLSHAIDIDPTFAKAYNSRGTVYGRKGDAERAVADFDRAIRLAPTFAAAFVNRAVTFGKQGNFDRALADCDRALALDPRSAAAHSTRGWLHIHKNELDDALGDFNRAIELDSTFAAAHSGRGTVFRRKGEFNRALDDFAEALRIDPRLASAYNNRALVYRDLHEIDKTIDDLNRAILLNPEYALAYDNRGNAWIEQGKIDQGITDFTQAVRIEPSNINFLIHRAQAYERQSKFDLALKGFNAALAIDKTRSDAAAARTRILAMANSVKALTASSIRSASATPSTEQDSRPAGKPLQPLETRVSQARAAPIDAALASSYQQPTQPAVGAERTASVKSLAESLAACNRLVDGKIRLSVDVPGQANKIPIDACFRGRQHLDCLATALLSEATSISNEYAEIVRTNYPNLSSVQAICSIEGARIDDHMDRAKALDARAAALQTAFYNNATCVEKVRDDLGKIDLSAMRDSGALMHSVLDSISEPIDRAAEKERAVVRLVQDIKTSQQAMQTVRGLRAVTCP